MKKILLGTLVRTKPRYRVLPKKKRIRAIRAIASDEYTCAKCHLTFKKGWSEEEALAEVREIFGTDASETPCAIVCDDCWQEIRPL